MHPDPQRVYATFERFSGKEYAKEMAHVAIAEGRKNQGFERSLPVSMRLILPVVSFSSNDLF